MTITRLVADMGLLTALLLGGWGAIAAAGAVVAGEPTRGAAPSGGGSPGNDLAYPWRNGIVSGTIATRISPPARFHRLAVAPGGFAAWLRGLPLRAGRPPVRLYDGRLKANQVAHFAVIAIDTGRKDLQQCADAVIRLRAEFLHESGCDDAIRFRFTSGDPAPWARWEAGDRPHVRDDTVTWSRTAAPDSSYANFRRYLDVVFMYAGTASLAREMDPVSDPSRVEPGNVFIHGGFPGHAILVVDVAVNDAGDRVFLLAQSYMPAQDIHILRNPASPETPWYRARSSGPLLTAEWLSRFETLHRFPPVSCGSDADRAR
ncbi:MAG: DUF4846 domain-containing protein [Acidobacteriota bacterium]